MRRHLIVLLIMLVPVLLFANVFQAFRHGQLERRIARLEREQLVLIEENKRAILAISVLTSPRRIGQLAEDTLGLVRISPDAIMRIDAPTFGGSE
jgi:cell division protein FtsL